MSQCVLRMILAIALSALGSAPALSGDDSPGAQVPAALHQLAGTEMPLAQLCEGLPWKLEVVAVEEATRQSSDRGQLQAVTTYRLRSTEPQGQTPSGGLYLRARLETARFSDVPAAREAWERTLADADPDTGLSYAWDLLVLQGAWIYHLNADCTFSETAFQRLTGNLESALVTSRGPALAKLRCRCGGACRQELFESDPL